MAAGQNIDYEALAQEAMRGVVRAVLTKVASSGLVGDHHFYIAFNTQGQGVTISKRLKEKYPEEMTIVLQHRFWDLEVSDERFEVKLTFDGIPEKLVVPFRCVKVFYDPSVPYGLQFEESELMSQAGRRPARPRDAEAADEVPPAVRSEKRSPRATRKPRSTETKPSVADAAAGLTDAKSQSLAKPVAMPAQAELTADGKSTDTDRPDQAGSKVVDFSKFRNSKK